MNRRQFASLLGVVIATPSIAKAAIFGKSSPPVVTLRTAFRPDTLYSYIYAEATYKETLWHATYRIDPLHPTAWDANDVAFWLNTQYRRAGIPTKITPQDIAALLA